MIQKNRWFKNSGDTIEGVEEVEEEEASLESLCGEEEEDDVGELTKLCTRRFSRIAQDHQ
jgi:hypothetical protein